MSELRMFVWAEFCPDYTDGLAFAIAPDVRTAQNMVVEKCGFRPVNWGPVAEYSISEPIAFAVTGGG